MHKEAREELRVRLKLVVLDLAHRLMCYQSLLGIQCASCQLLPLETEIRESGTPGIVSRKTHRLLHPGRTLPEVVEKIL